MGLDGIFLTARRFSGRLNRQVIRREIVVLSLFDKCRPNECILEFFQRFGDNFFLKSLIEH